MSGLFAAAGRFAVRFRWAIVGAWVVAAILANLFLPSLTSVMKQTASSELPAGSPSLQAVRLAAPFQNPDESVIPVVVARDDRRLTRTDQAAILRLSNRLTAVTNVRRVENLGESHDGQAAQLEVLAAINLGTEGPAQQLVAGLRHAITTGGLPTGLEAHLAGMVAAEADASQASQRSVNLGEDLTILLIVALLLAVFRSLLAPVLTLVPALLVTQLAGPLIGEAGRAGLQVSSLTQILMLILTLGAGTDYGLFLVFRVREELRAGRAPRDAVARAVARVGESITFSAGTVIAALLTLLLATSSVYASLGAPLAIAIGLMLLAGLTLQPALLAIAGRAAFWPSRTARGAGKTGWWGRIASRIVTRPAATLALGIVTFGLLALAAIGYQPAGFGASSPAPAGSDSAAGNALLATHFPAASSNPTSVIVRFPVSVWIDPDPVMQAQKMLAALREFDSIAGPFDVSGIALRPGDLTRLHAALGAPQALAPLPPRSSAISLSTWIAYRAESQFVSPDGRTILFDAGLTAGDPGSNAAMRQIPAMRTAVAAVARDVGARASGIAGEAPADYDESRASDHDLLLIIPVAILVITILLALVMRSLVAPLYLIASVAVSYLAAFGLAVLLFQDAAGASGLTYVVPFLLFVFLLALGEDYNILVMSRVREEAGHLPLRQAVSRALESTGSTVTSAGLVLAGTFGVFALATGGIPGGSVYRDILSAIALGILMDAFLVRTLLVPSTVALLGRWNWWPSRHGVAPAQVQPSPEGALDSGSTLATRAPTP